MGQLCENNKNCIISTLLVQQNVTQPRQRQWMTGEKDFKHKPSPYFVSVRFDLSESQERDSSLSSSMFPSIWRFPLLWILININKYRRRGQHDLAAGYPLCQLRSVDIFHQTGADQRPACAHAGGRIKPHHAQPHRQKKPLYTSKEIKSRVKSNSRRIVKMVLYTWRDLC